MSLKSISKKVLGSALLFGSMVVSVYAQPKYIELAEPAQLVKANNPEQVEVVEVFSYTCGHCYQLEAPVANWLKSKPEDVSFIRIQMPGEGVWENLARTYFTLETMNKVEEGHPVMYQATMVDRLRALDKDSIAAYLAKNADIDPNEFKKLWNSFPVTSSYNRALDLVQNQYKVDYTPVFIIDGKYLVNGETSRATSYAEIVQAVDEVSKELLAQKKKSAPVVEAVAEEVTVEATPAAAE